MCVFVCVRACVRVRVCVRECVCVCFGGEDERKEENKDNEKDEKLYDLGRIRNQKASISAVCGTVSVCVFFFGQEWQLSYLA